MSTTTNTRPSEALPPAIHIDPRFHPRKRYPEGVTQARSSVPAWYWIFEGRRPRRKAAPLLQEALNRRAD